ncbi:MAG: hypothetical protein ACRDO2_04040 [Nocardioidaceae bacterium]
MTFMRLNPLLSSDLPSGDGVEAGLEGDQGVLADPTQVLVGGPVGGQHVDDEPVVLGERGRLRMQRDRYPGAACRLITVLVRS